MLQAMEAARAKIELIARIFGETGIKWLFRGIHELCRKSYDQELRIKLGGQYITINPQEWRERDDITVNVGVATGNRQRELFSLTQIWQLQTQMIQAGGLGITVLPSQVYETGKRMAEALGEKNGDVFFFNPMMRQDPQVQQMIAAQMPQQGPDPQAQLLEMTAQVEAQKVQTQQERNQMDFELRRMELALKQEESATRAQLEEMKQNVQEFVAQSKTGTELEKARAQAQAKEIDAIIKRTELQLEAKIEAQNAIMDQYRAELQSYTTLEAKRMEIAQKEMDSAQKMEQKASETRRDVDLGTQKALAGIMDKLAMISDSLTAPKVVKRGPDGRPVAIGNRPIKYNPDGTINQIG
jgi:hypothetical protein